MHRANTAAPSDGDEERPAVQRRSGRAASAMPSRARSNRRVGTSVTTDTVSTGSAPGTERRCVGSGGRSTACSVGLRPVDPADLALLVVRVVFGLFLAAHGYNKVFGGGGLAGTARWFGSIGMRWPDVQARLAAGTEIGAGILFAARAADAARRRRDDRRDDRGQLRRPPRQLLRVQGRAGSTRASIAVGGVGRRRGRARRASLDHAIGLDWTAWDGWIGAVIAARRRPRRRRSPSSPCATARQPTGASPAKATT